MKKVWGIVFIILSFLCFDNVYAEEVHIYLFYGNTCPICEVEREYLKDLKKEYLDIVVHEFEVYDTLENEVYMSAIKDLYKIRQEGVPFTVVGDTALLGFSSSSQSKIRQLVERYQGQDYYDRVGVYLGLYEDEEILSDDVVDSTGSESRSDVSLSSNDHSFIGIIVIVTFVLSSSLVAGFIYYRIHFKSRVRK